MKRTGYLVVGTLTASLLGPAGVGRAQAPYYQQKLKPRLTLSVKPKRDTSEPFKYRASGKLKRPSGISKKAGCKGTVTIRIKQHGQLVGKKTTGVGSTCKYRRRVTARGLTGSKGTLVVSATFNGNSVLKTAKAPRRAVAFAK